jgi:hypothetical protein
VELYATFWLHELVSTVMYRILLTLALFCAPAAWAQNTTILNGESGSSVRGKLNTLLGHVYDVEQPPYSTAGSDYLQIQNAINDACSNGSGGEVLLGARTYNIGSNSINFNACIAAALVTGTAAGAGGAIKLTVANTTNFGVAGHTFCVSGVAGTTEANGCYSSITVNDSTHITLNGSTFVHAFSSSQPLGNISDSNFKPGIWLQGNGLNQGFGRTQITCSLQGFCIDKHNVDTATGVQMPMGLSVVDGMQVNNFFNDYRGISDSGAGGIRFEGMTAGQHISNCFIQAGVGIIAQQGTFSGDISHCNMNGGGVQPGIVGLWAGQIGVTDVRFVGWSIALANSSATTITNLSTESSGIGVGFGWMQPNTFVGFIDNGAGGGSYTGVAGNVLTVTKYLYGSFDNDNGSGAGGHGAGLIPNDNLRGNINTNQCPRCPANSQITAQTSITQVGGFSGAEGVYTLGGSAAVPPQTMQTSITGGSSTGGSLRGWQTERLSTGLYVAGTADGVTISNIEFTGTIGPGVGTTGASWNAANGGTLSYTLLFNGLPTGTFTCFAEGFTDGGTGTGYNFNQLSSPAFPTGVTCHGLGPTVEIRGNENAAINGGNITNPGANSSNGVMSAKQTACIAFGQASGVTIRDVGCGMQAVAAWDFSQLNVFQGPNNWVVLDTVRGAQGVALAPHNTRAGVLVRNSIGITQASLQINFADLPGQAGVLLFSPQEGDETVIVDALSANCSVANCPMGSTVTGGTGLLHRRVRYNGTNWIVTAQ